MSCRIRGKGVLGEFASPSAIEDEMSIHNHPFLTLIAKRLQEKISGTSGQHAKHMKMGIKFSCNCKEMLSTKGETRLCFTNNLMCLISIAVRNLKSCRG